MNTTINIGCPACGKSLDHCEGHSITRDREAFQVLEAHDRGDHANCHPDGCRTAGDLLNGTVYDIDGAPLSPSYPQTAPVSPLSRPTAPRPIEWPTAPEAPRKAPATIHEVVEAAQVVDNEPGAGLVWLDEAPTEPQREVWADLAGELKANEGHWAEVLVSRDRAQVNRCRNALRYHKITTRQSTTNGVTKVVACFNPKETT